MSDDATKTALIVDYGGVLTTNVFESFRDFCVANELDPETVRVAFREDPDALAQLRALERGEVTEPEFEARFGPLLGLSDSTNLIDRLFAGIREDPAMFDALLAARKAGVKTGLISNSWGRGRYDRGRFDELFDGVVISGEVGLHKPEAAIYELGCERVGVKPAEAVFVDDLRENCVGAEEVGMAAVLHRGAETTLPELEQLLGVELR